MREYQGQDTSDIGYGRTSDIDPMALGWVILLAILAAMAWRRLGKSKSLEDTLGYMAVIAIVAIIALLSALGNLL